ncbi:glycosyltransferase family 4 protein [Azospirillum canadense]|uniref:glycosyltransferase family 4 protein n=1 Tax=Azospirillum canadense TaxID=403962 RepID=UPI0022268E58|nr:glycosyltransferase family 4 protein [Azospirillum canadense]MCW2240933.1 glycosyltransferase involved in cell wall biosynthesis [Azospirillum canadense]
MAMTVVGNGVRHGVTGRGPTAIESGSGGDGAPRTLLHIFSSFGSGGAAVRFVRLANRLGPRYRHRILALDHRRDSASLLAPELDVGFLDLEMRPGKTGVAANLAIARRVLSRLRPDLLLSYNWGAVEWPLANRLAPLCPSIHFEDGFGPEEADGRQIRRRVWMRRLALGGARVVVPSRALWSIATGVWRLPTPRVLHIPNGIDAGAVTPVTVRDAPLSELTVGYVGALRAEKNVARLVRALALLPPQRRPWLRVIGDGPERPHLERLAGELAVAERVVFTGHVADPMRLLVGCDVLALSSDTEQMPLSVLEGMAAGLPVVSTDVGDVREMVAAANQALIVPKAEQPLAAALETVLGAPALRRALGQANRARVEAVYNEDHMVATYDRLFAGGALPSHLPT